MKRTIGLALILLAGSPAPAQHRPILPGTTPLEMEGDLSLQVIDQVDRFLLEMIERSPEEREVKWSRD